MRPLDNHDEELKILLTHPSQPLGSYKNLKMKKLDFEILIPGFFTS